MTDELSCLRQSILTYAKAFDPASLNPSQAQQVVWLCAQIEASVSSMKALAAARAADGNGWQHLGYRSPADHLADQTGTTAASARRTLESGRRMAGQPLVARAALAGELSAEQAGAVSDGVAVDPARAAELIDLAQRSSFSELNEHVAKVKADHADLEAQRRARHARRSLRRWTDRDGALNARLYGHPEDGALMWRMLDPVRRRLNLLRREPDTSSDSPDSLDNLDYDALMTIVGAAVGKERDLSLGELVDLGLFPQMAAAGPPSAPGDPTASPPPDAARARTKKLAGSPLRVMVRVDLDTLLRGVPMEGELCEIAGVGVVPVSVVEDMLATESPFIAAILTRGESLVGAALRRP